MSISPAVRAFRQRFHDANGAERADAAATSREQRFQECLELHGLALWMDIERAMREIGADRLEDVLGEVNARRLAGSPMPTSLRERARR